MIINEKKTNFVKKLYYMVKNYFYQILYIYRNKMNDKNYIYEKFTRKYVYFEEQKDSKLCGLHALNSLMQGPFFNEIILSEIGIELDQLEKSLYNHENLLHFSSV